MNTNTLLHKRVMRRVYYIFALRVLRHPVTIELGLFVVALLVFTKLVHVHFVIKNILGVPLGNVPSYVLKTVMQGEVLTLIALGTMVFVALSLPWQVRRLVLPNRYQQQLV